MQLKNGLKAWTDTSPKRAYRWQVSTRKDAHYAHEMQVKTVRYHCIPFRAARIQNTDDTKCGWIWSNRDPGSLLVEMQNGTVTLDNSLLVSYKTKHIFYQVILELYSLVLNQRSWKFKSTQKSVRGCCKFYS